MVHQRLSFICSVFRSYLLHTNLWCLFGLIFPLISITISLLVSHDTQELKPAACNALRLQESGWGTVIQCCLSFYSIQVIWTGPFNGWPLSVNKKICMLPSLLRECRTSTWVVIMARGLGSWAKKLWEEEWNRSKILTNLEGPFLLELRDFLGQTLLAPVNLQSGIFGCPKHDAW